MACKVVILCDTYNPAHITQPQAPPPKDLQLATNMHHASLLQAVLSNAAVSSHYHSLKPAASQLVMLVPFLAIGS